MTCSVGERTLEREEAAARAVARWDGNVALQRWGCAVDAVGVAVGGVDGGGWVPVVVRGAFKQGRLHKETREPLSRRQPILALAHTFLYPRRLLYEILSHFLSL